MNFPLTIGATFSMSRLALRRIPTRPPPGRCGSARSRSARIRRRQFRPVFGFLQRSGDASDPQLHVAANRGRHLAAHHHVRDREAPARLQHAKRLAQHAVLVARKIDHAVRDDHVDRIVGQRDIFDLALEELDVLRAGLALVLAREREHLVGHVEAVGLAGRADAARREQHVDAAAGAEVEHRLARFQFGERGWIAASERSRRPPPPEAPRFRCRRRDSR